MEPIDDLRKDYRAASGVYANRFENLRRLRESAAPDQAALEAAALDLQKARIDYNCARDRLARRLGVFNSRATVGGRPTNTAERDRSLIHKAGARGC